ncbi:MAG: ergothioneine biosynthesis protein EgtB [Proteobacteria bacterium]|nr:ergothioneine biosynthesis protein EgtB [Pseudomonadota bacterium]
MSQGGSEGAEDSGRVATIAQFRKTRALSLSLAAPLTAEDQLVQSMDDVSPTKWHLAHTTWFFETFILKPYGRDYVPFDPAYNYLFNSYYNAVGERHPRAQRGLLSRPRLEDIHAYRAHVDDAMDAVLADDGLWNDIAPLVTLGVHHEQQHQELSLMDIKHVFSCNSLKPAYMEENRSVARESSIAWAPFQGGMTEIGGEASNNAFDDFTFDNEGPVHKIWLNPFKLASRPVTNGEYQRFIEDGGYTRPEFWLSDGWDTVATLQWNAPLYWEQDGDSWSIFTLRGQKALDPNDSVCHVSFYEADAYARWADARLPTEAEWEFASFNVNDDLRQMFGDVWQWTQSAYVPYPGFKPGAGAVGEYNGKFMSGQMVLRGGCRATPEGHIRNTYRNFFYPHQRWQFAGIRLAADI